MIISVEFNRSFSRNFYTSLFKGRCFFASKYYQTYNSTIRIIQYKCEKFVINVNGVLVENITVMLYN